MYSRLTSSHVVCSHPILRLTRERVTRLTITQLSSQWVKWRPCRMLISYSELTKAGTTRQHTVIKSLKSFQVPNL